MSNPVNVLVYRSSEIKQGSSDSSFGRPLALPRPSFVLARTIVIPCRLGQRPQNEATLRLRNVNPKILKTYSPYFPQDYPSIVTYKPLRTKRLTRGVSERPRRNLQRAPDAMIPCHHLELRPPSVPYVQHLLHPPVRYNSLYAIPSGSIFP